MRRRTNDLDRILRAEDELKSRGITFYTKVTWETREWLCDSYPQTRDIIQQEIEKSLSDLKYEEFYK